MDNSHVALVSMLMSAATFQPFRCDRNIALGINLSSLQRCCVRHRTTIS